MEICIISSCLIKFYRTWCDLLSWFLYLASDLQSLWYFSSEIFLLSTQEIILLILWEEYSKTWKMCRSFLMKIFHLGNRYQLFTFSPLSYVNVEPKIVCNILDMFHFPSQDCMSQICQPTCCSSLLGDKSGFIPCKMQYIFIAAFNVDERCMCLAHNKV